MSEITDIEGETVPADQLALSMWMIENDVYKIELDYSGSGDSGDITCNTGGVPDNIQDIACDLLTQIVYPNFNNSGSYGSAVFFIKDGILSFECDHHDIIETTDDKTYEQDLLDTSKL